jgi:hypothetical protein
MGVNKTSLVQDLWERDVTLPLTRLGAKYVYTRAIYLGLDCTEATNPTSYYWCILFEGFNTMLLAHSLKFKPMDA